MSMSSLVTVRLECVFICSASPGGNYSASFPGLPQSDLTFHPLPDRDRSRIASGLWVRRLPPVHVTVLLIVWVTLSEDTRNVLVEMDGFEPPRFLQNRFTVCRLQPLGHISMLGQATGFHASP
jgi:hypothetical protein